MNPDSPIGIFDSGVGGSSIWREIHRLLPFENTIYLADSKNAPYGHKSKDEITALSIKNTETLIEMGSKLIVVACNTATTNAISVLRDTYNIPIIGIEPAVKPAALQSSTKKIGILATKGTLSSILFHKTSSAFSKEITMVEIVGEGLVQLIEAGKIESDEMTSLLLEYTAPMIKENIDYLVLGCSHYPYLIPQLQQLLPSNIKILDSGEPVARHTQNTLSSLRLLRKDTNAPTLRFYTNAETETLAALLQDFSEEISVEKKIF
ncbi:glutamate racemase [Ulvibacter antarcticus]|uniref:Glutamate racemase n=1 Tax=Ulvibacter antarcticus TaxID=442714 RepID=A0A3L9YBF3_9FLAO|nr:glutamate racemase [Ulvibacter antarcticus]RMA56680.1 glutamate racemase [Ulvibacter antarcticus]